MKYFIQVLYCSIVFLLITNTVLAQNEKIKIAYSWLVVKPFYAGAVQINPETNEQSSAVRFQIALYIKVKKSVKPNYIQANYQQQKINLNFEDRGEKIVIGTSTKTGQIVELKSNSSAYNIWQITFNDFIPEIPQDKVIDFSLKYPSGKLHYFSKTPIFIDGLPAE